MLLRNNSTKLRYYFTSLIKKMKNIFGEILAFGLGSIAKQKLVGKESIDWGETLSDALLAESLLLGFRGLDNALSSPRQLNLETEQVFNKGKKILFRNPRRYRRDALNNPIKRDDWGKRDKKTGWEKDHMQSVKDGGSEELCNKQPLQYEANIRKGSDSWENDCNS